MIKGGIYQDLQFESMFFIPLEFCKNGKIFVISFDTEGLSNQKIQEHIYNLLTSGKTRAYAFWYVKKEESLESQANGYIGKVDKFVYEQLCKELYKQEIWNENH